VGGEKTRERASERGRKDVSERREQEENVCIARRPPRRLLRATSRSSERVYALATLPCPCLVCHQRQTDIYTPLLLLYIGFTIKAKNLSCALYIFANTP